MTPEVRAAAARLSRVKAGERVTAVYLCPRGNSSQGQRTAYATVQQTKDRRTLADWALANLPAEDEEQPVTEVVESVPLLKEYGEIPFVKRLQEQLSPSQTEFVISVLRKEDYCGNCFDKGPWCCYDPASDYE